MALSSSRRNNKPRKESIYREVASSRFIGIRTINEIEDIVDTSEAYMTDPTVIFNSDNTKVLFYYNTKDPNEIEEMKTLFKRTVSSNSTITLSDASYLDESSGDDTTYDISGTYRFEKYDENTKTIIAAPLSINKQSTTYLRYDSKYWLGSLLWTTLDSVHTRTTSYEIVNFIGNDSDQSFSKIFGTIQNNDRIEIVGVGTYTVESFSIDSDEGWERIKVKEEIAEKDYLGDLTFIRLLRSEINQPKKKIKINNQESTPTNPTVMNPAGNNYAGVQSSVNIESVPPQLSDYDTEILRSQSGRMTGSTEDVEAMLINAGMSRVGINRIKTLRNSYRQNVDSEELTLTQNLTKKIIEQSPEDKAKEAWLSTGSTTLTITVVPDGSGRYRFRVAGGDKVSGMIELDAGSTILVKQSDKSNGTSGYTKQHHPLRFSRTSDGVHRGASAMPIDYITDKVVGNSGSYYYITVPTSGRLFYYCEHHSDMGGEMSLVGEKGACCYGPCTGGANGPRRCHPNKSERACKLDSFEQGKWFKGQKCPKSKGASCCDPSWDVETAETYAGRNYILPAARKPDDPPVVALGSCCFQHQCQPIGHDDCITFGGVWSSAVCGPNSCENLREGACCTGEDGCTCTNTTEEGCLAIDDNGSWNSNQRCDAGGVNACCPQDNTIKGKCCWGSGCMGNKGHARCGELTAYQCAMRHGTWSEGECANPCCGVIELP